MAVTADQVQQLYIAYFNRPADFLGLSFQVNQANQFGLQFVADQFAKSPEYLATYAGKGTAEVINTIYKNLFGRDAEPAGIKFWGDLLNNPKSGVTLGNAAITIATGAINDDKVSVANKLAAANAFYASLDTSAEIVGYSGDAANQVLKTWMGGITTQATLDAAITPAALLTVSTAATAAHDGAIAVNVSLTTGLDNVKGGATSDTISGLIGTTLGATDTLTALDSIDGGAGNNILNITDLTGGTALPAGLTVSNVQTVNVVSAGAANINTTSGFAGLANLNITRSAGPETITAGAGQNVSVVDTAGKVTIVGGANQTVTTAGGVALSGATGAITVTDTAQAAATTSIIDGTNVNLTTTSANSAATVTIGGASHLPTGNVNVVQNVKGVGAAVTGGAITVNGGSTVKVAVNATNDVGFATSVGVINVNGSAATTSATVTQTAAVAAAPAITATTAVKHVDSVVFAAMTAGQTSTVAGLTFTATGAVTAAQAAAAFASLAANATNGSSTLGVYSGKLLSFGTGAVSGANSDTVTFTASTAVTASAAVAVAGSVLPVATPVAAGVTGVDADAGTAGVFNGAVHVLDLNYGTATAGTIASVTVDGFAVGSDVKSDALTSLSLANSDSGSFSVYNNTATTLGLTVSGLTTANTLNLDAGAAKYTTLNLVTAGAATSVLNVTAAAVTSLNISGVKSANLASSTFTALKTVTVSGSAGVTMAAGGANVTDVNASATSGNVTLSALDASKATYEGGSGTDSVTLSSATVSKAISLGAGNDTVTLATGTVATTAVVDGGIGTDTLSMVAADAVNASLSSAFSTKVIGFETLKLTGGTGAQLVHVDTLGAYNAVSTGGEAAAGVLTMDGFTSGGTLTLTSAPGAGGSYIVSSGAFTAPTTDAFNITVSNAAGISAGSVTANKIETINLTSTDTTTTHSAATNTNFLTLLADSATSIVVKGNANLNLTSANTTVTSVDASGMTGGLIYTAAGTTAETVKGGAAANTLTAGAGTTADVLIGGAGKDKLFANTGADTLTGGAGNDWFAIQSPNANVNTYSTITDATKGDMIVLKDLGAETFSATKVTLAATAVFQDYANAVIAAGGTGPATNGYIGWFQYSGDTYVVESLHSTATSASFVNGVDVIVKLTGLVDLSTMTLNDADGVNPNGFGGAPILLIA